MDEVTRFAVIDDDRLLVEGLDGWAADRGDLELVVAATTVDEMLWVSAERVDVVLLDLVLRDGSDPIANVRRLVAAGHCVLVVSVWCELREVAATFAAGARGYLTKDNDLAALAVAIHEVVGGGTVYSSELAMALLRDPRRPRLSARERAVLIAYASGMTLKAAARHVGVQPETAKTYLGRVKAKYQELGRPVYTKLDLAERVREDCLRDSGTELMPPKEGTCRGVGQRLASDVAGPAV